MRDLREILDDREDRGPTARDVLDFIRHYRERGRCGEDHEPYAACMTWADAGWTRDGFAVTGRSPRRTAPRDPETITYTAHEVLTTVAATELSVVDRCRARLAATVETWCNTHGYVVVTSRWANRPPDLATATVEMVLEADLLPRTDGEWPALHQAMAEDAADRQAATEASTAVGDRLDALRGSAAVWSARDPRAVREALTGA